MLKTVSSIANAIGALNYKGAWNASTNSPALASGVGAKGDYYVVGTAGTTTLDGISNWGIGDWAVFNGSVWQRVEGGADLNGVNLSASGNATIDGTLSTNNGNITTDSSGNVSVKRVSNGNAAFGLTTTNSNNAGWNASGSVQQVSNDLSTGRSINATGTLNGSGFDYAEYMTKTYDFTVAKGDVVGVDAQGMLTNIFADAVSFVIKSTAPSYVGGDTWGVGYEDDPVALEQQRQKVDRIAFCGQVPVNVIGASPGQYIVAINVDGKIKGAAVTDPSFEQYKNAVGKVIAVEHDGRAKVIVKIS